MRKKASAGIIILVIIIIIGLGVGAYFIFFNYEDKEKSGDEEKLEDNNPVEEDLNWQCPICPSPCRYEDDSIVTSPDYNGSCICIQEGNKCVRKISKPVVYTAPKIEPANFLGEYVSKEAPSNWMNYAPIKNKVEEITLGLNKDMDKAEAIANWVKHSKTYMYGETTSIANQGGTVIDIFEAQEGVCLDSAILTTAMMRLAKIPAIAVIPVREGILPHQLTYFYADGRWWQVDSTFSETENVVVERYEDIRESFNTGFAGYYLCSDEYHEENSHREFTRYLSFPVKLIDYGDICLPFFQNYGQSWERAYISPESTDNEYHYLFTPGLSLGDSYSNLENNWENYKRDNNDLCDSDNTYISEYLYCLQMPVGKYQVVYNYRNENNQHNPIATLNFEIKSGETKKLVKEDFVKDSVVSQENYDLFIKYAEKILSYNNY